MKIIIGVTLILTILVLTGLANPDEIIVNFGETQDYNGHAIKLKGIRIDKAVVSVDRESGIFEIGEEKVLSGVKVKLNDLFYAGDREGNVKLSVSALYICGDGQCNGQENKETCCRDCGCNTGYDCEDNKCLIHVENECNDDSDCDDNNENTLDKCSGGRPKKCTHIGSSICEEDSDCDDSDSCTTDKCRNNDCFNDAIPNCVSGKEGDKINVNIGDEEKGDIVKEPSLKPKDDVSFLKRILNFFKNLFSRSDS